MAHKERPVKAGWITRQLTWARNVLANPIASGAQRKGARSRLNRVLTIARELQPIPLMRRELEVDRQRRVDSELHARRRGTAA